MPANEILEFLGINLAQVIETRAKAQIETQIETKLQNKIVETARKLIAKQLGDLDPQVIAATILQSTKLTDLQKDQAIAILTARAGKTDYLQ